MEIGVLGLTFCSGNKGCEALSYSFIEILNRIASKNNEVVKVSILTAFPFKSWIKSGLSYSKIKRNYYPSVTYKNIRFDCLFYTMKCKKIVFFSPLKKCKCIFDFTAGDSFTDLYGLKRFYDRTLVKKKVIDTGVPLILGSQTVGPFDDKNARYLAVEVINKATEIYTRDNLSFEYVKNISGRTPKLTSDIAFALPYTKTKIQDDVVVGFNPSGLLWNGGYTKNNQFNLLVDYREYCRGVIIELLKRGYKVILIPHAFRKDLDGPENDLTAATALHEEFPETIVESDFSTPMDIKSLISGLGCFIGARMHATIGAFSAGVPVIPFSYSRKFEGLFESLNYDFVICGKEESTKGAIERTLDLVEKRDYLKEQMKKGLSIVNESNNYIAEEMERTIFKS